MSTATVRIRPRREEDVPVLAAALLAQQPQTRYPFRDPLPVPVETFLHVHDAVSAWTAELDGEPVGHVCRVHSPRLLPTGQPLLELCAEAHGCDPGELTWVSTLFVAADARGHGIGRRLMEAVVDDALAHGQHPCLEVLPNHPAAMSMYQAMGWRTVHRFRPDWLTAVAGDEGPDVEVMVLVSAA